MRPPSTNDFPVDAEGVGRFTFGRRKMMDEVAIQREFARILSGVEPTEWLEIVASWIATFKTMIVNAPPNWDVEEMDPLDPESYAKMKRVYDAFREKELSFRSGPIQSSESSGT